MFFSHWFNWVLIIQFSGLHEKPISFMSYSIYAETEKVHKLLRATVHLSARGYLLAGPYGVCKSAMGACVRIAVWMIYVWSKDFPPEIIVWGQFRSLQW